MAYGGPDRSFEDLVRQTQAAAKTLTVADLKNVLRQEGLQVSGNKPNLQIRIISHISRTQENRDRSALERIKNRINPGRPSFANSYPSPYSNHTPTSSLSPRHPGSTPARLPITNNVYNMPGQRNPFQPAQVNFTDSPFYHIRYSVSNVLECKIRESTRDQVRLPILLQDNAVNELQDKNVRIMVFCAADGKPNEIAFPHQVELKVNDSEVKANLRGLKNKPGSTRPADITELVRRKAPRLNNTLDMTYALTTKDQPAPQRFYLVVNLVQRKPIETLVAELQHGKSLSRESVINELQREAADPDIVATSSVMSLKCPLSYMRISTPCRGIGCKHNQCFDAASYLQLQEQAPTWTCPVCNKTAHWNHLVLDLYMQDILMSTAKTTEEVTIEPDGRWHLGKGTDEPVPKTNGHSNLTPSDDSNDDDDDDVLEIVENPATQAIKREQNPFALTPTSVRTPPLNSRDGSRAPSGTPVSRKRPADVIDLTISDDDNDDDQPPMKRQRPSFASSTNPYLRPPDRTGTPGNGFSFTMPPPNPPSSFDYENRFGPAY